MKLSIVIAMYCAAVGADAQKDINKQSFSFNQNRLNELQRKKRAIETADGNINMIELHIQTMLSMVGEEWEQTPRQMLNYGCYCQLISRQPGVGKPLDALDKYDKVGGQIRGQLPA